eukprot:TRINITY_DN3942_c2_g2_i2.p2 TRINITY_DN3942_c2_g2~~TRINITY_DN3942_c2_g2_i2.p2  ORF type:complete len:110 (+),score=5.73 TRINITY_DN3942_c2_g2_i2:642-971(+)
MKNMPIVLSVNIITIWVSVNGSICLRFGEWDRMVINLMSLSLSLISEQFLDTNNSLMTDLECSDVYQYVRRKVFRNKYPVEMRTVDCKARNAEWDWDGTLKSLSITCEP